MAGEVVTIHRGRARRGFAVLAVIAAGAQIFFAADVAEKDRFWLYLPACGLLAVALLLPVLWRSSDGTRAAAVGYLGFPGGMVVGLPFNFLPESIAPFAVAAAVLAAAALIFFLEHRATVTLSPAEGWVSTRGRRLRFDEVAGVLWDGLQITTPGTFSSSSEDLARLDLIGPDRRRITLDTTSYRNAAAALHEMRDWSVAHLVDRISTAVADGDTVRAGPITFAPSDITIQRPRPWSASSVIVVFAVLGILPTVIAVALLIDQSHFNPRPLLIFTPLVVVLLIMAIQAHLLRKPLTFPSGTAATIENGHLILRAHHQAPHLDRAPLPRERPPRPPAVLAIPPHRVTSNIRAACDSWTSSRWSRASGAAASRGTRLARGNRNHARVAIEAMWSWDGPDRGGPVARPQ